MHWARLVPMVLSCALVVPSPGLAAQPLTNPLTPEQVACDAERLEDLFFLTQPHHVDVDRPWTFFASPSQADTFGLLQVLNQWEVPREGEPTPPGRVPEVHLAATLTTSMRPLLLNPERPRLDQVALVRDDANSNHHFAGVPPGMTIVVDPVMFTNEERRLLIVDLFAREGATRPGRALTRQGINQSCHDELTGEDRLVFSVLQRILRPRQHSLFPFDVNSGDSEVAVYRDTEPDSYLIDSYRVDAQAGQLFVGTRTALRLRLQRDADGRLETGSLELLTPLDPPHFLDEGLRELFVIPPTFAGVEVWDEEDPRVLRIPFPAGFAAGPVLLDLATLLDGSTWNPRRPVHADGPPEPPLEP